MRTYEEALRESFFRELDKLAEQELALFFNLEKIGSAEAELLKEAFLGRALQAARGGIGKAKNVFSGAGLKTNVIDPSTGMPMTIPMSRPGAGGLMSGVGKSLEQSGKLMKTAPSASGFNASQLQAAGLPKAPGVAGRVGGEMVGSIGHHIDHKGVIGNTINPFGSLIGGAAEGLTRGTGKELVTAGKGVSGRAGGALRATGKGMQRVAPGIGLGGEIAGVAGLGAAMGVPLSAAGAAGGKAMSAFAPGIEHLVHGAGDFMHHAAHDIAGTAGVKAKNMTRKIPGFRPSPTPAVA